MSEEHKGQAEEGLTGQTWGSSNIKMIADYSAVKKLRILSPYRYK